MKQTVLIASMFLLAMFIVGMITMRIYTAFFTGTLLIISIIYLKTKSK